MRAWIALVGVLLFAHNARAEEQIFETPVVAPLARGDAAPIDAPNYFDEHELGTATVVEYEACLSALQESAPDTLDEAAHAFCACNADAARSNIRVGRTTALTDTQTNACVDYAKDPQTSPFASRVSFVTIYSAVSDCLTSLRSTAENLPALYAISYCGCSVNAALAGAIDAKLEIAVTRCEAAARYRNNTGRNLSRRQFASLKASAPQRQSYEAAPTVDESPSAGQFIRYEGNGGGPTLCGDGSYSHSSGRGTCSHHRGIAGGSGARHRRH